MDEAKIREVVEKYDLILRDMGGSPRRSVAGFLPSPEEAVDHLRWMVTEVRVMLGGLSPKTGKAFRWLGFIQGAMWVLGVRTVDEMRADNMPGGGEFEPRR